MTSETAGLKWAPEIGPRPRISTTRIAPVGIVLPSSASATFPPASLSAMIPEPTTVATSSPVPSASAARRCAGAKVSVTRSATRRPCSSTTRSPSSLTNSPCCGGRRSRTASDGRHRRTPLGVTTIGRLIRIGCAIMASRSWSSVRSGSSRPSSLVGRALLADDVADRDAHAVDELPQQEPGRRRLQVLDDVRLDAGIADHGQRVAGRAAIRVVVDDDVHGKPQAWRRSKGRTVAGVAPSRRPISFR